MELVAEKYKQTEVGLIPSDWEVKTIGEIFTFYSTSNFSKAEMSLNGEVGCVHYGLIHAIDNSHYSLSNGIKYYVTKEQAKYETIQEGDVIMVDASEDLVGLNKSVEVYNLNNKEYIAGLHTFHLRDINSNYVGTFRGLILNSNSVKKQMLRLAVGMKVFGVSKPQLQQVFVPVPPKTEQTAIATALSDADALISGLEKLIAKKRNIKQGAMQKLLQPKEGWEVKKLGEIAEIYTGKKNNQDKVENGLYPFFVRSQTIERINTYSFDGEAILIPGEGNIGKIFHYINGKFDYHQRVYKISDFKSGYFSKYIYRYISEYFGRHAMENSVKATVDSLRLPTFQVFEIPFPPTYKEQENIATILSDMDAEITAIETKLEKYRKIKLGMMQNLLTGKIRLV